MSAEDKQVSTEVEGTAAPAKPQPNKRKRMMIVAAAAAVLLAGGCGGAYALMGGEAEAGTTAEHGEAAEEDESAEGHGDGAEAFVDVPAMVINLRNADGGSHFLKLHFMLVPGAAATPDALRDKLPLLLDAYQPFLRELRPEDLAGSAAVFRIKEEMLVRANATLGSGKVKDVLIQDLIQQ
ncbi:flagellar basal body-associated FliL family protein [Sphingomonas sp. ac-8]|uniref:flagellar basal body-associated FliL family protein n=1 Tax=Sphingomonas sp. ac-8 TaxID=3242977 RepID=UPI003A805FC7